MRTKVIWNSVFDIYGAEYMCTHLHNMYLATLLDHFEYMCMPINLICGNFSNGFVYIQIEKDKYCLLQAGIFFNKLLHHHLVPHRYHEHPHMPNVLCNLWWQYLILSTLHLSSQEEACTIWIQALNVNHEISLHWKGGFNCGIN